jgi:hypothetical protein
MRLTFILLCIMPDADITRQGESACAHCRVNETICPCALLPLMRPILLFYCLTPDDFTRQGESAGAQWVKQLSENWENSLVNNINKSCP